MNDRHWKLSGALFAGGTMTTLTALVCISGMGLFGLVLAASVGAAIGWAGYEFRALLRAIPQAACETMPKVTNAVAAVAGSIRAFFAKPRPFFWGPLYLGLAFAAWLCGDDTSTGLFVFAWAGNMFFLSACCWTCFLVVEMREATITWLAPRAPHLYCRHVDGVFSLRTLPVWRYLFISDSVSYDTAVLIVLRSIENLVYGIGLGAYWVGRFVFTVVPLAIARFVWTVYKKVHCEERLIDMVYAPFGGITAYVALRATIGASGIVEIGTIVALATVLSGGMLALLLGMASYELVSKRWFHLIPAKKHTRR